MALPSIQTEGDTARVQGKLVNGLIVIPVSINGAGPFWLGMDTGAMGHLRLNNSVAERLALPVIGKARASDPSGKNPREVTVYRVDSLSIGGVRLRGPHAIGSADTLNRRLPGVDGILGIDLFADRLLTLDYPKAELRLSRDALPDPNGADVIAYQREHGPIQVSLQAGERQLLCDLDTGNLVAPFVLSTDLALSLPRKGEPRSGGTARTASQQMEIRFVTLAAPLRIGSFEFPGAEVAFPSLHERGNIGSKALGRFTVEIDQRNKRIRFARNP
jgi:Aspartyl protease